MTLTLLVRDGKGCSWTDRTEAEALVDLQIKHNTEVLWFPGGKSARSESSISELRKELGRDHEPVIELAIKRASQGVNPLPEDQIWLMTKQSPAEQDGSNSTWQQTDPLSTDELVKQFLLAEKTSGNGASDIGWLLTRLPTATYWTASEPVIKDQPLANNLDSRPRAVSKEVRVIGSRPGAGSGWTYSSGKGSKVKDPPHRRTVSEGIWPPHRDGTASGKQPTSESAALASTNWRDRSGQSAGGLEASRPSRNRSWTVGAPTPSRLAYQGSQVEDGPKKKRGFPRLNLESLRFQPEPDFDYETEHMVSDRRSYGTSATWTKIHTALNSAVSGTSAGEAVVTVRRPMRQESAFAQTMNTAFLRIGFRRRRLRFKDPQFDQTHPFLIEMLSVGPNWAQNGRLEFSSVNRATPEEVDDYLTKVAGVSDRSLGVRITRLA